jgi:hypothetical protein
MSGGQSGGRALSWGQTILSRDPYDFEGSYIDGWSPLFFCLLQSHGFLSMQLYVESPSPSPIVLVQELML